MKFGLAIMNDFPPGTVAADRVAQLREQVRAAQCRRHRLGLGAAALPGQHADAATGCRCWPRSPPTPATCTWARTCSSCRCVTRSAWPRSSRPSTTSPAAGPSPASGWDTARTSSRRSEYRWTSGSARFEESVEVVRVAVDRPAGDASRQRTSRSTSSRSACRRYSPGGRGSGSAPDRTAPVPARGPARRRMDHPAACSPATGCTSCWATTATNVSGSGSARPADFVVRRELVLDDDPERARRPGRRRSRRADPQVRRVQRAGLAPPATATCSPTPRPRRPPTGPISSPTRPGAVAALKALDADGITYVILRMQWYDLPHERMLQTLKMFREQVRPAFQETS